MRIKLIVDLPIDKIHKCFKGEEFEVTDSNRNTRGTLLYFIGGAGEECAAYKKEVKILNNNKKEIK
tara:strand:+ start:511 stop:708 length:198 start_codon:yes stop_codon:yes gene_type:complete